MQNTVQAFGCFLKQHWNGGRGESRKNLLFIAQTNESVTFSQRVLSKIVELLLTQNNLQLFTEVQRGDKYPPLTTATEVNSTVVNY